MNFTDSGNYVIEQLQNHKRKDIKYEIQHSRRST